MRQQKYNNNNNFLPVREKVIKNSLNEIFRLSTKSFILNIDQLDVSVVVYGIIA